MDGQMGGICASLYPSPAWKFSIVTAVTACEVDKKCFKGKVDKRVCGFLSVVTRL